MNGQSITDRVREEEKITRLHCDSSDEHVGRTCSRLTFLHLNLLHLVILFARAASSASRAQWLTVNHEVYFDKLWQEVPDSADM